VVIYDDMAGNNAVRLWWMLRYLGHAASAVLDGGWAKWRRERRPTRSGDELRRPVTFAAAPRPRNRVEIAEVVSRSADGGALLRFRQLVGESRDAEHVVDREQTFEHDEPGDRGEP
jgi:thiosulfate/3-mercaptopyruvate sulfurtransferase